MNEVIVSRPAKINLFLNITGKQNNMHLLNMINQSVDLYDYLSIKPNGTGEINIQCQNQDLPLDETNSCFKAALFMKVYFNIKFGFDIKIVKSIPQKSGLGEESTDAAGVMLGIKEMLGLKISENDLISIGMQIGADVPFCLIGGICLVKGFGEQLTRITINNSHYYLIVCPSFGIDTAKAFSYYDKTCSKYKEFDGFLFGYNDLEIVAPLAIQKIREVLCQSGALCANMSGSGSSVVGTYTTLQKQTNALKSLKNFFLNYDCTKYAVKPCEGVKVIKKSRLN